MEKEHENTEESENIEETDEKKPRKRGRKRKSEVDVSEVDVLEEILKTQELPILPVDDLVIFPYMPPHPPFPAHHVALFRKDGHGCCRRCDAQW